MNVLIVTGIWPPDVGGPATHAPEVAHFLSEHGHNVEVVTTADMQPAHEPFAVRWTSRRLPPGARHVAGAALVRSAARRADVVYSTGMFTRSAAGARAARRPYVLKLTSDPAFERARRRGEVAGDVDAFQAGGAGGRGVLYRTARNWAVRRAAQVVCPSSYLRELAIAWGAAPERASVLPNPAPDVSALAPRDELRERLKLDGTAFAFAGRLTVQKSLDVALDAFARVQGCSLVIAGEGGERQRLEEHAARLGLDARVRFVGALDRRGVLELFRAADAALLSSSWENFPHVLVEALAAGTPVISTAVGGVDEIVTDGQNGLLVPAGDAAALAVALARFVADDDLQRRLRIAAAPSVERFAADQLLERLLALLESAAR